MRLVVGIAASLPTLGTLITASLAVPETVRQTTADLFSGYRLHDPLIADQGVATSGHPLVRTERLGGHWRDACTF